MSNILNHLDQNPQEAKRLIGLEYELLQQLLHNAELLHDKRILVEHRIRAIKIWRVVQERFRLNPQKYERVILTICGLVRLQIKALILPTERLLKTSE